MEAWSSVLVSLIIVCTILAGGYVGYEQGMFDPLIEKFGYASLEPRLLSCYSGLSFGHLLVSDIGNIDWQLGTN